MNTATRSKFKIRFRVKETNKRLGRVSKQNHPSRYQKENSPTSLKDLLCEKVIQPAPLFWELHNLARKIWRKAVKLRFKPMILLIKIKAFRHPQALGYNYATVMFKNSKTSRAKGCKGNLMPNSKALLHTTIHSGAGYLTVSYSPGLMISYPSSKAHLLAILLRSLSNKILLGRSMK